MSDPVDPRLIGVLLPAIKLSLRAVLDFSISARSASTLPGKLWGRTALEAVEGGLPLIVMSTLIKPVLWERLREQGLDLHMEREKDRNDVGNIIGVLYGACIKSMALSVGECTAAVSRRGMWECMTQTLESVQIQSVEMAPEGATQHEYRLHVLDEPEDGETIH